MQQIRAALEDKIGNEVPDIKRSTSLRTEDDGHSAVIRSSVDFPRELKDAAKKE